MGICQTAFSVSALSATTWTMITVNWAFRLTTSSNLGCYYSVYANGALIKPQWISGVTTAAIAYAPLTDVVRFGGFLGKLAEIKIYSPGSLQVNSGNLIMNENLKKILRNMVYFSNMCSRYRSHKSTNLFESNMSFKLQSVHR